MNYGDVTCMLVGLFLFWSQPIKAANYGQELENNAPRLSFVSLNQGIWKPTTQDVCDFFAEVQIS